jgi:hypothetical protein
MLALVNFAEHFRYYLLGKKFLCRTNNMALRWLLGFKEPSGQIARWLEWLAEFDFDIEHRAGRNHGNADGVSRRPKRVRQHGDCPSCGPTGPITKTATPVTTRDEHCHPSDTPREINAIAPPVPAKAFAWEQAEIVKAQEDDPDMLPVLDQVKSGKEPTENLLRKLGTTSRAMKAQYPLLVMKDGCLYLRSPKDKYKDSPLLVLPISLVAPVLSQLHDGFSGAHLGQLKTELKVRQRVWRPGLKRQVIEYIRSCQTCQKCKSPPKGTKAPMESIPVGRRFQRLHIDIIGPINPPSRRGYRYILVVQDAFSKWPEAWPLRNQKANTCARVLVSEYITRFGVPEDIHSDQGTNFESKLFKEMCSLLGIRKTRTTAYHPQGNGQVENLNKSLKSMLTAMVDEEGRDWDRKLPSTLMSFRSSVQVSTGETPFSMNYGEEMRLPIDLMFGSPPDQDMQETVTFVQQLRGELEVAFERVRQRLGAAQRRQRTHYDKNGQNGSFAVGALVLLKNHHLRPDEVSKFHRKWKGPYRVLEKLSEVNFRVENVTGGRIRRTVVHLNNMKPYYSREEPPALNPHGPTKPKTTLEAPLPPTESVSSDSDSEDEPEQPQEDWQVPDQLLRAPLPAPRVDPDDIPSSEPLVVDLGPGEEPSDYEEDVKLGAPPVNDDVDSSSEPEEEEETSSADDDDGREEHYGLRPRASIRKPARYCNAAQLLASDYPDVWSDILSSKRVWLRRGRELRSKRSTE